MDFTEIEILDSYGSDGNFLTAPILIKEEDKDFKIEKILSGSIDNFFEFSESVSLSSLRLSPAHQIDSEKSEILDFLKDDLYKKEVNQFNNQLETFHAFENSAKVFELTIKETDVNFHKTSDEYFQETIKNEIDIYNEFNDKSKPNANDKKSEEQIEIELINEGTIIEEEEIQENEQYLYQNNKIDTQLKENISNEEMEYTIQETTIQNEKRLPSIKISYRLLHNSNGSKLYGCLLCDYSSSQIQNIKSHSYTHSKVNVYRCMQCPYSCRYKYALNLHLLNHSDVRPYSCSTCNYRCKTKQRLAIHERIHSGEKPFQCEICDYAANSKGRIKTHMFVHKGGKPFKCNLCSFSCLNNARLKLHMKKHLAPGAYQCDKCEQTFTTKKLFKGHSFIHDDSKKTYQCSSCPRIYSRLADFNKHKLTHNPNYLKCKLCKYVAKTENKLKIHSKKHKEKNRFCCLNCDYSSHSQYIFDLHMTIHSDDRPLNCSFCTFQSDKPNSLWTHLKCHISKKGYQCLYCPFMCLNLGNFNRHVAKH